MMIDGTFFDLVCTTLLMPSSASGKENEPFDYNWFCKLVASCVLATILARIAIVQVYDLMNDESIHEPIKPESLYASDTRPLKIDNTRTGVGPCVSFGSSSAHMPI